MLTDAERIAKVQKLLRLPGLTQRDLAFIKLVLSTSGPVVAAIPETGEMLTSWTKVADRYKKAGYPNLLRGTRTLERDAVARRYAEIGCGLIERGQVRHIRPLDAVDWAPLPALHTWWRVTKNKGMQRTVMPMDELPRIPVRTGDKRLDSYIARYALDVDVDDYVWRIINAVVDEGCDIGKLTRRLDDEPLIDSARGLARWINIAFALPGSIGAEEVAYRNATAVFLSGIKDEDIIELAPGQSPMMVARDNLERRFGNILKRAAYLAGTDVETARRDLAQTGMLHITGLPLALPCACLIRLMPTAFNDDTLPKPRTKVARANSVSPHPVQTDACRPPTGATRAYLAHDAVAHRNVIVIPDTTWDPELALKRPYPKSSSELRSATTKSDRWRLMRKRGHEDTADYRLVDVRDKPHWKKAKKSYNSIDVIDEVHRVRLDMAAFKRDPIPQLRIVGTYIDIPNDAVKIVRKFVERASELEPTLAIAVDSMPIARLVKCPTPAGAERWRAIPMTFCGKRLSESQRKTLATGEAIRIKNVEFPNGRTFSCAVTWEAVPGEQGKRELVMHPI